MKKLAARVDHAGLRQRVELRVDGLQLGLESRRSPHRFRGRRSRPPVALRRLRSAIAPRFQLLSSVPRRAVSSDRPDMRDLQSGILNARIEFHDLRARCELHFVEQRLQADLNSAAFAAAVPGGCGERPDRHRKVGRRDRCPRTQPAGCSSRCCGIGSNLWSWQRAQCAVMLVNVEMVVATMSSRSSRRVLSFSVVPSRSS